MWPEPTLLRDKLYGNLEELKRTSTFVRVTGISVWHTTTTKKIYFSTDVSTYLCLLPICHLPTYLPAVLTYAYLFTICRPAHIPSHLPVYLLTYLPTFLLTRPPTFHLGFVHPLQDVTLRQCLPLPSVYCFPVSGCSLLSYVVGKMSTYFLLSTPVCYRPMSQRDCLLVGWLVA